MTNLLKKTLRLLDKALDLLVIGILLGLAALIAPSIK